MVLACIGQPENIYHKHTLGNILDIEYFCPRIGGHLGKWPKTA